MNQVNLVGRIVQDLTLRKTNDGNSFTGFRLAVNEYRGGNNYTNFIDCVAFGNQAENIVKYVGKGSLISVTGRLSVRNKQENGNYVTIVNVNVDRVEFLDSRNSATQQTERQESPLDLDTINGFEQEQNYKNTNSNSSDEIVKDDDSILWD